MVTALEERARSRSEHLENAREHGDAQPRLDLVRRHIFHQPRGNQPWKLLPETPTGEEIMVSQEDAEDLPRNLLDAVWPSKDAYLETQYRLLRREGTEALRFAVNDYKSRKIRDDNEDVCIYSKVYVLGYLLSRLGVLCRISFSTEHAKKRINWTQSRRLMPGTLVAISTKRDNFRSICQVATVAQRPYRDGLDQNPPQIDIIWADVNQSIIDPDMELIMVEARVGYYEAVRHTLVGLQMASESESPFFKYILGEENEDHTASFISENPILDLTPILRPTSDDAIRDWVKAYDVREPTPDIRAETTMDETQLHALYRMVTKELCIVQGPPGTGKTFTSVEALKVLLANQGNGDPPIIIAAQTNHALDQLLHLCLDAGALIVRVGGRTESERIREHTMFEVRKRARSGGEGTWRILEADRRKFNQEIGGLANTVFNDSLLDPVDLLNMDVLTQDQYDSLVDEDMEQTCAHQPHGPFSLWLSGEVVETDLLRNKYSETDLAGDDEEFNKDEYECEGDFEHIAADEEDEDRIRGHWVSVSHKWSGKEPAQGGTWHRRAERELNKSDLFNVPKNWRGAVYQVLYERYIEKLRPQFIKNFTEYNTICKELKASKWHRDMTMVRSLRLNIVGCTTTGLTKYRGFLAALKAKTMLIEEAAETREANIVSALYPSIQQLILVGDHQQLTPFSNVRWLSQDPYFLDVSMFQRMVVNLHIPYIMLDKQRRMAPEIRAIVDTFYDGLEDHPVALQRQTVPGMGDRRTWLFTHNWEDSVDANRSRFNVEEASMIANFFAYLVNNGIDDEKITVLTYYMAQKRHILRKLRQHPSLAAESYHVHTIDSYQGEENDIVLLSLVRSPASYANYAVGFLESKNRAIVAISRARRGFYMFGNMANAVKATKESGELWGPIQDTFNRQQRVDPNLGLPLECQPHGKVTWIKNNNSWGENAGGCGQRCTYMRPCGHQCTLTCHFKSHEQIRCSQVCGKMLACGHKCQTWCKSPCNCVCDEFQSVKNAVIARQKHDQAQSNMQLEDILLQEAGIPIAAASRKTGKFREAILHPSNTQETQTPDHILSGTSKLRKAIRLTSSEAYMTAPPNNSAGGRVGSRIKFPAKNQHLKPPNMPPVISTGQRPLPLMIPPHSRGNFSPVIPGRGQGRGKIAEHSYQHFVQTVAAYDKTNDEALRDSLEKTSGIQPSIRETYRPVAIVGGKRIEAASSGNSPQKLIDTHKPGTAELPTDSLVPELVADDGMVEIQWEPISSGSKVKSVPRVPHVASTNGSRHDHTGLSGSAKATSIPAKINSSNMLASPIEVATVLTPPSGVTSMIDAQVGNHGGGYGPRFASIPTRSYAGLASWVEGLTIAPPPETVATRPSSADASEFCRSAEENVELISFDD